MNLISKINVAAAEISKNPAAFATATTGKPRDFDDLDEAFLYRSCFPDVGAVQQRKIFPKKTSPTGIIAYLKEHGFTQIYSKLSWNSETNVEFETYGAWFHPSGIAFGYQVSANDTSGKYGDDWYDEENPISNDVEVVGMGWLNPVESSEEIEILWGLLKKAVADSPYKETTKTKIGIISHNGHNFYTKNFKVREKEKFEHGDLHYGEGFMEFNDNLINRVKEESKGLILFHGEPGTGKTQYIRYLLKVLRDNQKSILYVPPSFSTQLTEPHMIEFISSWVKEEDRDCILLIEDAEPLLEVRVGGDGRTTGISNLLNMTDGLLNDMLGLMVIATFNTEISKIDSALLRPGRLIARKEFGKVSKERAQELAKTIGFEFPADLEYPATLAEIYSYKKAKEIIVHNVVEKKINRIGFGN